MKPPASKGLLFHPDLIRGTALGQEIRNYQFFSYEANEALHLSLEERRIVADCLNKIATELEHPIDKHSRRLITAHIGVLLDYCLRFYDRQFTTRSEQNRDVIVRFERLLDEYFESSMPQSEGLPSVRYFAEKVFLSPNYFGDMVRKQTGKTASEYIQTKIIERAKENLLSSDKTTSQDRTRTRIPVPAAPEPDVQAHRRMYAQRIPDPELNPNTQRNNPPGNAAMRYRMNPDRTVVPVLPAAGIAMTNKSTDSKIRIARNRPPERSFPLSASGDGIPSF